MNWIRVATKMKGDPRIGAIAAACKIRVSEAVGLVCCALMEFPDHARDGDLSDVPDVVLEQWALWHGKPGVFAAAFEANLCDQNGIVRAWEKHNGAAIRRADTDIERKRTARDVRKTSSGQPAERPPDKTPMSSVDETRRTTTPPDGGVVAPPPSAATAALRHTVIARFTNPRHQEAVFGYLRSAQFPDAVLAHLDMATNPDATGDTPEEVGQALHEMRLNGVTRFNVSLLAGYIRRGREARSVTAPMALEDEDMLSKVGL